MQLGFERFRSDLKRRMATRDKTTLKEIFRGAVFRAVQAHMLEIGFVPARSGAHVLIHSTQNLQAHHKYALQVEHFSGTSFTSAFYSKKIGETINSRFVKFRANQGDESTAFAYLYALHFMNGGRKFADQAVAELIGAPYEEAFNREIQTIRQNDVDGRHVQEDELQAEFDKLTKKHGTLRALFDDIRSLREGEIRLLANHFRIDGALDEPPVKLVQMLILKAEEFKRLVDMEARLVGYSEEVDRLRERIKGALGKGQLKEAAQLLVETLSIARGQIESPLELYTDIAEQQVALYFLNGQVDLAFHRMEIVADCHRIIDDVVSADKRCDFSELLCQHAEKFGGVGFDLACDMMMPALDRISRENDMERWCLYHMRIAQALQGKWHRRTDQDAEEFLRSALDVLQTGLKVFSRRTQTIEWADAKQEAGRIRMQLWHQANIGRGLNVFHVRDRKQSVEDLRASLEFYERNSDQKRSAKVHSNLALAYMYFGKDRPRRVGFRQLNLALKHSNKAIELWREMGEQAKWLGAANHLGHVYRFFGRRTSGAEAREWLSKSLSQHEQVIKLSDKQADPKQYGLILQGLSLAHYELSLLKPLNLKKMDHSIDIMRDCVNCLEDAGHFYGADRSQAVMRRMVRTRSKINEHLAM